MQRAIRLVVIVGIVVSLVVGCEKNRSGGVQNTSSTQLQIQYQNWQPEDVYQLLLSNNKNVVVIDVRTPAEYTGPLGHIPGAQLYPIQDIEKWVNQLDSLKNSSTKIVLYCRSGHRSRIATEFLAKRGFTNLINMLGGMVAWNKKGLPVER